MYSTITVGQGNPPIGQSPYKLGQRTRKSKLLNRKIIVWSFKKYDHQSTIYVCKVQKKVLKTCSGD